MITKDQIKTELFEDVEFGTYGIAFYIDSNSSVLLYNNGIVANASMQSAFGIEKQQFDEIIRVRQLLINEVEK